MKILAQAHLSIFYILFCRIRPGAASVSDMFMTSTPGRLSRTFTPSILNVTFLRIRRSFTFPACMLPSECLLQLNFTSSVSPVSTVCVRLCVHWSFLVVHLIAHFPTLLENSYFQQQSPQADKLSTVSMNEFRQIPEEGIFTFFVLELALVWKHCESLTVSLLFSHSSLLISYSQDGDKIQNSSQSRQRADGVQFWRQGDHRQRWQILLHASHYLLFTYSLCFIYSINGLMPTCPHTEGRKFVFYSVYKEKY